MFFTAPQFRRTAVFPTEHDQSCPYASVEESRAPRWCSVSLGAHLQVATGYRRAEVEPKEANAGVLTFTESYLSKIQKLIPVIAGWWLFNIFRHN
jgi:hypothetical protein